MVRVVVPGLAHHVTQPGKRRQQTFFHADDYLAYRMLIGESCLATDVAVFFAS